MGEYPWGSLLIKPFLIVLVVGLLIGFTIIPALKFILPGTDAPYYFNLDDQGRMREATPATANLVCQNTIYSSDGHHRAEGCRRTDIPAPKPEQKP